MTAEQLEFVDTETQNAFPLFLQEVFDVAVNSASYVVGVNQSYPSRLRGMISAAILTYMMGNKSIDYVFKEYIKDDNLSGRFDERIDLLLKQRCDNCLTSLVNAFVATSHMPRKRELRTGEWIAGLTIMRLPYSLRRAFAEADKGALFEAVAIGRSIFEQISWAHTVWKLDDSKQIRGISASKTIGPFSKHFSGAGRFYGWMSQHSHWKYEAHLKALSMKNGYSGIILHSCDFKAIAYAMLVALTGYLQAAITTILLDQEEVSHDKDYESLLQNGQQFDPTDCMKVINDKVRHLKEIAVLSSIVAVLSNEYKPTL